MSTESPNIFNSSSHLKTREKPKEIKVLSFTKIESNDQDNDTYKVNVPGYGEQTFQAPKGEITASELVRAFYQHCVRNCSNPDLNKNELYTKILANIFEPVVAGEAEIKDVSEQDKGQ